MKNLRTLFTYSIRSFLFMWSRSKEYVILTFISIVIGSVQVFPGMYLMNYSIDLLTNRAKFSHYLKIIAFIMLIMLSLSLLSMLIGSRLGYAKSRLGTKIRLNIDDICLNTDYANLQSKTFMENKNFALAAINNGSLDVFIQTVNSLLSSILIMSGVLYIISQVSFLILIPLAVSLGLGLYNDYLNARQNFIDTKEQVEYERKSSYLRSISSDFSFAKEIRMFNLKDRFKARMDEVDALLFKLREIRRKRRTPSAIIAYLSDTVIDISLYLYFGYKVIMSAITLGQFSLYSNALRQLKSSVEDIIYTLTNFVANTNYLKGFFDFMDLRYNSVDVGEKTERIPQAKIQFENVSFRYPEADSDTLKDINITVNAGETLLVIGENGAGKSTFIKLLCGLYRPTKGRILLNGTDISTIDQKQYMRQISAVFQDYKLFAASIAENICSMEEEDPETLKYALKQVNLSDKVDAASAKTDTQLYRIFDENGVEFSGGEMQRLAIARAIYKDTPILVLDEPTSALDPKAEYEIYASFQSISQNRTAVYISHRLSSIKFSDKVAVFDDGRIVEYGTHEKLMEMNGLYAELYSIQAGLYLKEDVK